ncbi:MAG: hypothetical protein ABIT01_14390 [Thermoanaerobaculia bacterium]
MALRAALLLTVLGLVSCRKRAPDAPGPRADHPVQITTDEGVDLYPDFSPDGTRLVYSSNRSGKFELYIRTLSGSTPELQLTSDGHQNFQPRWAPDGKRIAYHAKQRGGIWIVPSAGGAPKSLADFGSRPTFSPDGEWVTFQSQNLVDFAAISACAGPPSTIWIVPSKGGPARNVTVEGTPQGGHGHPVWSPDGRRIYFVSSEPKLSASELWSIRADGTSPTKLLTEWRIYDPAVSPDGESIYFGGAFGDFRYGIWRLPLERGTGRPIGPPVAFTSQGFTVARSPALSPDGKRLIWSALSTSGNLFSLPLSPTGEPSGPPRALTQGSSRNTWPIFSPDASKIAFGRSEPGTNPDVWMMDADGKNAVALTTNPAIDYVQDWFPGGTKLLIVSNRTKKFALWTLALPSRIETPLGLPPMDIGNPRLSPDGTRIAFNSKTNGITINAWTMDLQSPSPKQLTFDRELLGFPAWSPDGKLLAMQVKRGDDMHIALLESGGGTPVQLTSDHGLTWPFSWSPDGDKIAFAGTRQNLWNVYWVSRSSRHQTKLTTNDSLTSYVRYPCWSPRGDSVVYEFGQTTGNLWAINLPAR